MLIRNQWLHRIAAFSMAAFGLYVFLSGVNTDEYKVLDDGSLIESSQVNLMCFKHTKTILTFRAGFDIYRSICYGLSSFFLFVDLLLNSGHLTLPALVLAAGEIVNDFSDFCLAVAVISIYIGGIPAAAYGITYLALLVLEVAIWLGTCKFHETCRLANFESRLIRKKQQEANQGIKKEREAGKKNGKKFCFKEEDGGESHYQSHFDTMKMNIHLVQQCNVNVIESVLVVPSSELLYLLAGVSEGNYSNDKCVKLVNNFPFPSESNWLPGTTV